MTKVERFREHGRLCERYACVGCAIDVTLRFGSRTRDDAA